jgi:hypothetical protein
MPMTRLEVDRTVAGRSCQQAAGGGRKVRAPQDRVVGNADRSRGQGKCHRKHTADGRGRRSSPPADQVRVKRCGKSAPAAEVTRLAW